MTIKVLNKKWKIIVRSDKYHGKLFGACHGIAVSEDRKIHIRRSSLDDVTLIHEIVHAYQFELSYFELELDDEQTSEWFAELWAKHGRQILSDADRALIKFKYS
jgi:hypothetical protein